MARATVLTSRSGGSTERGGGGKKRRVEARKEGRGRGLSTQGGWGGQLRRTTIKAEGATAGCRRVICARNQTSPQERVVEWPSTLLHSLETAQLGLVDVALRF